MAKKETKKPTGLSITRKGTKFTLAWNHGEKYVDQKLQIRKIVSKKSKWQSINISSSAKKYSFKYEGKASKIAFRVWGLGKKGDDKKERTWSNKADADFTIHSPKKPSLKANWGGEEKASSCSFTFSASDKEHYPLEDFYWESMLRRSKQSKNWKNAEDKGTFSSSTTKSFNDAQTSSGVWYRYFRIRSRGLGKSKGKKSDWVSTKFVYADPLAPQNVKVLKVAEEPPNNPRSLDVLIQWDSPTSGGTGKDKGKHPITNLTIEYCVANPNMDMMPVDPDWKVAKTVKDTSDKKKTKTKENIQNEDFNIPQLLAYDQCVWIKVVAHYAGNTTESDQILFPYINNNPKKKSGLIGYLTPPVLNGEVSKNSSNYTATINVSNPGAVTGTYIAVVYNNPKDTIHNNNVIRVLKPSELERDVAFQCPEWEDPTDVSFDIYSFIPDEDGYEEHSSFSIDSFIIEHDFPYGLAYYGTKIYLASIYSFKSGMVTSSLKSYNEETEEWYMEYYGPGMIPSSDLKYPAFQAAWANKDLPDHGKLDAMIAGGIDKEVLNYTFNIMMRSGKTNDIAPNYPTNVKAVPVQPEGTIQVTWDNTWKDAAGIEVSWADHDDALYSTNAPSTFEINTAKQNKLNISGLEMGKTWYVWVRMFELGDSADAKIYGPYSDMQTVELVTTPAVPVLNLSPASGIITKDQSITLSWIFVTNDNTSQALANIYVKDTIDDPEEEPAFLTSTTTDQSIDIDPSDDDINWEQGSVHYVAVEVQSETGRRSGLSDFQRIEIAEPITAKINPDLTTMTKAKNPVSYSGSSITIEDAEGEQYLNSLMLELPYNSEGYTEISITHNEDVHAKSLEVEEGETPIEFYGGSFDYLRGILYSKFNSDGSSRASEDIVQYKLEPDNISLDIGEDIFETEIGTLNIVVADNSYDTWLLEDLPVTVKVDGAGEEGTTILMIQRDGDFPMPRPNDETAVGYDDETLYYGVNTAGDEGAGDRAFTIDVGDIVGYLDDGGNYILTGMVQDSYGQVSQDQVKFRVQWADQAVKPTEEDVDISVDDDEGITTIKVMKPETARTTDTIDIYRLSADKPELIISGASFYDENNPLDTTYVDPYPTIGRWGGYRVVLITKNGDYNTPLDGPAWEDFEGSLDTKFQLIDFGGKQVPLKYNVSLDNSWNKTFTQTHYLGGGIEGDWMAGTERTGSLKGVNLDDYDPEGYDLFRDLGDYTGICNVRTIDGTNIKANVEVSDSSTFNQVGHPHDITLNITKVDNPDMDGVTLRQWQSEEE